MELLSWASALGFLFGMRHAIEPDHIAAVSTIVSNEKDFRRSARVGLAWGIGHTLVLLLVGGSLLVLRLEFPERLSSAVELGVGLVLIALGAANLRRAAREGRRGPLHVHSHGPGTHLHAGAVHHVHVGRFVLATRPLILGLLHGFAGTGALAAMILASMPTITSGVIYIAVFGAGSMAGMTLVTGVLGKTLENVARGSRARAVLIGGAGALSLVVGVAWVWLAVNGLAGR
jgi:hypothetical protein